MKTCPYCAEEIQDEAIKCRYCGTMLVGAAPEPGLAPGPTLPPGPGTAQPTTEDEALQFSHSGQRYLLGYGSSFFGIWDRLMPGAPVRRFPRTDEGWRDAWHAYVTMEPDHAEVGVGGAAGQPAPGIWQQPTWGSATPGWSTSQQRPTRPVSGAWWLLPIFFGLIGGFVAWIVNKDNDPRTARNMLFVGIAVGAISFLLFLATLPSFGTL